MTLRPTEVKQRGKLAAEKMDSKFFKVCIAKNKKSINFTLRYQPALTQTVS